MILKSLIVDDELLARKSLEHFCGKSPSLELLGSCEGVQQALSFLSENEIDLIFLDINMPEYSGFDLLDKIAVMPQVIFTTGNKEYAFEAYEYDVTDFLKKPFTLERFNKAVKKAVRIEEGFTETKNASVNEELYIKSDGRLIRIPYSTLQYFENVGDYVKVVTDDETYVIHATLKGLAARIQHPRLIKVHRSYIINLGRIKDIEDNSIVIEKKVIPISRAHRAMLMKRLNIL